MDPHFAIYSFVFGTENTGDAANSAPAGGDTLAAAPISKANGFCDESKGIADTFYRTPASVLPTLVAMAPRLKLLGATGVAERISLRAPVFETDARRDVQPAKAKNRHVNGLVEPGCGSKAFSTTKEAKITKTRI